MLTFNAFLLCGQVKIKLNTFVDEGLLHKMIEQEVIFRKFAIHKYNEKTNICTYLQI